MRDADPGGERPASDVKSSGDRDQSPTDELVRLQRRAYGPEADIAEDVTARRRLKQLERERSLVPVASRPEVDVHVEPVADDDATDTKASVSSTRGVPARAVSRRRVAMLVLAVVLSGAVGWIAATALETVRGDSAKPLATLRVDDSFRWPSAFGQRREGSEGYERFAGMQVLSTVRDAGSTAPLGNECLYVVIPRAGSDDFSGSGAVVSGCSAGAFPASVTVIVTDGAPALALERFPVGTPLHFVQDGDQVLVYGPDDPIVAPPAAS